jgi:hypothetical protein
VYNELEFVLDVPLGYAYRVYVYVFSTNPAYGVAHYDPVLIYSGGVGYTCTGAEWPALGHGPGHSPRTLTANASTQLPPSTQVRSYQTPSSCSPEGQPYCRLRLVGDCRGGEHG